MAFTIRGVKIEKKRINFSKLKVINMNQQWKLRRKIKKTLLSRPQNISMNFS